MSLNPLNDAAPSKAFLDRYRRRANEQGAMRFDTFVDLALYDEEVGYYRHPEKRVGYGGGTDFFTASTSGPIFGELICAACRDLLPESPLSELNFIELGAETPGGVLEGVAHPFRSASVRRLGEPLDLEGTCVIFSNELFDAQPFRRFVRNGGVWRERGVHLEGNKLTEAILPATEVSLPSVLPVDAPEGYQLDLPIASVELLNQIVRQRWSGLFIAFDYGKRWDELIESSPAGTARAYYQHQQSNDLLARPGQQDLTCHVCWDWLSGALEANGFKSPQLQSQEAFFVHHAGDFIGATIAAEASRMSQRKLAMMQLLHPAHLGQKFQVLHARRELAAPAG